MAFVTDGGGRIELFEAKWTELANAGDCANLRLVRGSIGPRRLARPAVVCRTAHAHARGGRFEALSPADLE